MVHVVCSLLLILTGERIRAQVACFEALPWLRSPPHAAALVSVIASKIAYIVLANTVGFLIVAPLARVAMFIAFGVRPVTAVVVAVVGTLVIWYAFYKLLRVPLPWGVLERFAF
jgi:putative tricarboxylic transport membrane protein